jgi:hypothetical protein
MSRWALLMALPLLLAATPAGGGVPLWPRETEAQLQERLEKEHNPVKKAKETARLARMKLRQAMDAYNAKQAEEGVRLVGAYLGGIKDAWQMLRNSGRNAANDSRGFKELDFELRDDEKLLHDLERRIPYYDRDPVEKAEKEIEQVRLEVMQALFPTARGPESRTPPDNKR